MPKNITINMENLSDKERGTLLSLIKKANVPQFKSPFSKVSNQESYFFINSYGDTEEGVEEEDYASLCLRAVGNYCTDQDLLERRAEKEMLSRLLWKFSIENDNNDELKGWCILYDDEREVFYTSPSYARLFEATRFSTQEIARRAIDEVVKPYYTGRMV